MQSWNWAKNYQSYIITKISKWNLKSCIFAEFWSEEEVNKLLKYFFTYSIFALPTYYLAHSHKIFIANKCSIRRRAKQRLQALFCTIWHIMVFLMKWNKINWSISNHAKPATISDLIWLKLIKLSHFKIKLFKKFKFRFKKFRFKKLYFIPLLSFSIALFIYLLLL